MTSADREEELWVNGAVEPQNQQRVPPQENPNMLSVTRSGLKRVPDSFLDRVFTTYLCLEGNRISSLPASLFLCLTRLQWLDLRNNLILSLPAEIGSHRSLETLLLGGNPVSELPAELGNVSTLRGLDLRDCPLRFPPQAVVQQGCKAVLQYLRSALAQRPVAVTETLAVVEKLQLSQLMGSEDESEDRDGLQRFRELRDKLVPLDRAELDPTAQEAKGPKPQLRSVTKRKKTSAKAGKGADCEDWKAAEGRLHATKKELRDKRTLVEQWRKSQKSLPKERAHPRTTPVKKTSEHKKKRQERQRPAEEDLGESRTDSRTDPQVQVFGFTAGSEEDRSARELQRHIRTCVERIQERRRNPRGSVSEQTEAAEEEDVEEVRKSQARLLGRHLENCFTIFTADSWSRFPSETSEK
ncbi:leucine-rich repeat-containing protein 27 isoform X2 [Kryptolebias marmoratus]|uniref:leucine-rich repeat-containing protein 27 isoform X2 n=1 Tax=Kryptolebias marmoratus TaxID=37003 RepID=UPI000D530EC1|nr:leucine-rich repeat-containing protein 27 isoform X2 [Kryptolebias marmoratus]